jgi:pimeloyl-ACP methyl ester carboxylesterase
VASPAVLAPVDRTVREERLRIDRAGLTRRRRDRRGPSPAPRTSPNRGIDEVTDHYRQVISGMDRPPVVIGHSFGCLIAQKLFGEERAAAVVAIDAGQIKGVLSLPLSALHSTLPVFNNPANKHQAVSVTSDQFRRGQSR